MGDWIDPPLPATHTHDAKPIGVTAADAGRRWKCSCGQVLRVFVTAAGKPAWEVAGLACPDCGLVSGSGDIHTTACSRVFR